MPQVSRLKACWELHCLQSACLWLYSHTIQIILRRMECWPVDEHLSNSTESNSILWLSWYLSLVLDLGEFPFSIETPLPWRQMTCSGPQLFIKPYWLECNSSMRDMKVQYDAIQSARWIIWAMLKGTNYAPF